MRTRLTTIPAALLAAIFLHGCFLPNEGPGFSETEALHAVAAELCPQRPEAVLEQLVASQDTYIYYVYVPASEKIDGPEDIEDERDVLAVYAVGEVDGRPGDLRVSYSGRSERLLESTRRACAEGRTPELN